MKSFWNTDEKKEAPAAETKEWWHEAGQSAGDALYDPSHPYQTDFTELLPRMGDSIGLTVSEQESERRALSLGLRELEAAGTTTLPELKAILRIVVEDRLKPPTVEEIGTRDITARRQIREKFGAVDGERVIERTKKLLASNPKLQRLLKHSPTAVNHPSVVLALAHRAWRDPGTL